MNTSQPVRSPPDPSNDPYGYSPLPHWHDAVSRLGELASQPEGRETRPLFDLAKQLSTSCISVFFHPSVIDHSLYLSNEPLQPESSHQARVCIQMVGSDTVEVQVFKSGAKEADLFSFARLDALPGLTNVLSSM